MAARPSLIAAVTERADFCRKSPYGELPKGITVQKSHQKRLFRPKGPISAERGLTVNYRNADGCSVPQPKDSYGRKMRP